MAAEAGATNGIVAADDTTLEELGIPKGYPLLASDPDARYAKVFDLDAATIPVTVAAPFSPSNAHPIQDVAGTKVDQVVVGGCTNGLMRDLRMVAGMLRGRKAAEGVRLIVVPATQAIFLQAAREGLIEIFAEAGAVVTPPGCGPCGGSHLGVLGPGEVCLSTTPRNFPGRMGARDSRVYLANPLVAAATAITGVITHPGEVA
jgi:3-isopropylmalate/(R)-2-methylmalate dehydratase large subunit